MSGLNITGGFADAVIVMYNEKKQEFALRRFAGDCCDTAIYTCKLTTVEPIVWRFTFRYDNNLSLIMRTEENARCFFIGNPKY